MATRTYRSVADTAKAQWSAETHDLSARLGAELAAEVDAQVTLGRDLAAMRAAAALTQGQLAARASVQQAEISRIEDLANEIRLSFDYVEGQFDVEVSTVVLSGGSSQLPNASAILGNLLGRPVHVFDPLAGLDLVPSRYDIHALDANSPSLA